MEGREGVEYFSFASDENFFHALHTGERTVLGKLDSWLLEGKKDNYFSSGKNEWFILFTKKQSFVTKLIIIDNNRIKSN